METYTNIEDVVNDGIDDQDVSGQGVTDPDVPGQPNRKKYHSSAMYAASMWHSTVTHVKHSHGGSSLLPAE